MKKIISWLLTVAMCLSLVLAAPPIAYAAVVTQRYIYDAEALPGGGTIGVLFIYGGNSSAGIVTGGTLYYGVYNPDNDSWTQQPVTPGGGPAVAAKDAAMALDGAGNPHIAYVFTGGDNYNHIGYTYWTGSAWAEALSFGSVNHGERTNGTLSASRLAVDSGGTAHIAYIDSQGNNTSSPQSDVLDLMHRSINGGAAGAPLTVVHGYYENIGGSDYLRGEPLPPAGIVNTGTGVYIGSGKYDRWGAFDNGGGGYNIIPVPSGTGTAFALGSGNASNSKRGFTLYGMASDGSNIYSLYYVSGGDQGAGLHIAQGTAAPTLFLNAANIVAGDITTSGTGVYAAGISGTTLTLFQNAPPTSTTLSTALFSNHTRMATVVTGGNQYIFYTGNDAGKSLFIASVPTGGGALREFQVPNKTPVTITGVTVDGKVYDGTPPAPGGTLTVTGADLTAGDLDYAYTSTDGGGYSDTTPPVGAGAYKLVISVPESNANYSGASADIPFTITQRPLTVNGTTVVNRDYAPGNSAVFLNTAASVLAGLVMGDEPNVTLEKGGVTGTMIDANAGDGKSVTVTGFALSGIRAVNYALSQPTGITVNILPAELAAPAVSLSADSINGGLSATVSDSLNTGGVSSYSVEVYEEDTLKKTLAGLSKDTDLNIPLETGLIEPESSYAAKARAVADASGNYSSSALGDASSSAIAAYAPLVFTDSDTYDIPASKVGQAITPINVSGGVSGGKSPYAYSADGLPGWAGIDAGTGIISGTPDSVAAAGAAVTVTVTDAQSSQQSIAIACGAVGKGGALSFGGTPPPAAKTYGDPSFDIAGLTYDGGDGTVSYSYVDGPGSLSGSTLTPTGAGSIVVQATGTSANYEDKTENYTITVKPKPVTITPASTLIKVYGEADPALVYSNTPLAEGDSLTGDILIRAAGEDAGDYAISLSAGAAAANPNYELTLASGSYNLTITKKALAISGAAINAKSYDETTAIDLSDVTSVTFSGDLDSLALGTDFEVTAAAYTGDAFAGTGKATSITVALKNTAKASNYIFTGGAGTYAGAVADITAAAQTIMATNQTLTVSQTLDLDTIASSSAGTNAAVTYAIYNGTSDFAILSQSLLTATAPGELKININSAAVNVDGIGDIEYSAAAQKQITVTVSAKTNADDTITFEDGSITYGQTYTPSPTTTLAGGTWSYQYAGTARDGTAYDSAAAPTKAGSYTVTATFENDTHIGAKTVNLTIGPKLISITGITAIARAYDGTTDVAITGGTLNGIVGADAVTSTVPATGAISDANAGNDKAVTLGTITLAGADRDNYTLIQPADITVNIVPKVIAFTVEAVASQEYTGSQLTQEPTVRDGGAVLTKDTHYTLSYGANLNAGTGAGSITVTGIGNYLGSRAEKTFDITKATYGGSVLGTKQVISNTAAENVTYDLSSLVFPEGFSNKSFVSVTVVNDSAGLLSGASVSGNTLTFDAAAKAAGTSGELHVVVRSNNYNDYTAVVAITTVDKTPVTLGGVIVPEKTYNAAPAAPGGTPANNEGYSGAYEYWYIGTGSTVYGSATAPTNAGNYRLTVRIPATDPTYTGEQTVDFSILKAGLTVKPQNMSIYIGDALPTPVVIYEGLQGSDAGTAVAQLSSGNLDMEIKDSDGVTALANSAAGGSYAIVFTGSPVFSAADNYTMATVAGTLTINNRPSGGGGGGGTPLPAAPRQEAHISDGIGAATIEVNTDSQTGSASVELTATQLSGGRDIVVTIPQAGEVTINILGIPVPSLSDTSGAGSITLNTVAGNITLPSDMLAGTDAAIGSKAQVSIGTVKTSDLPLAARDKIGNHPIVSLQLSIDGKAVSWNNPEAPVTLSIPYTATPAELQNPDSITAYYIDGSGNLLEMKDAKYDPVTKAVIFTTTHFSYYAVGYKDSVANVQFSDVLPGAWYYDAVTFIAENGITYGTGDGKFSPESALTRGQFIVMLMRAYSVEPDASPADNFSDAGNTYYTGYLAAAKRLGVSAGVGNNMYAPGKEITRQEMFTLLYNALNVIDQLPEGGMGKTLSDFTDAADIAPWAKEAMTLLVKTGTVGGSEGMLTPTSTTTRAQMAQVLFNLLKK